MKNIAFWIESGLILGGILILVMSLIPVRAIIQQLPEGKARTRWKVLFTLIFIFIAGYSFYPFLHPSAHLKSITYLVVPVIFFGGANFVFLVCSLSLKTTLDLKQIFVLEQEIVTDSLMGIYNRRYLNHRIMEEIQRAKRYEVPFSVFLLDIDHFKKVNDT